MQLFLRNKREK